MTVLKQRVFEGFCAADEQAAIEAVLFLGNPVAPAVLADKDDGRCRIARWGFDEFHFCIPSCDEQDQDQGPNRTFRQFSTFDVGNVCRHREPLPASVAQYVLHRI